MTPVSASAKSSSGGSDLLALRHEIMERVFDVARIERPIDPASRLAHEIKASTDETAQHFLGELCKHCTMLVAAIADVLGALAGLDSDSPFSASVLTRGLIEAAADLFWLSDAEIDAKERTRRTCLVYLRQHETLVGRMVEFSERHPEGDAAIPHLAEGIAEGWESLKLSAEGMAAIGFELRTSKQRGSKYSLGGPKPSISRLVDVLITRFLGKTGVNLYAIYSPTAHGDGEGLGTLLIEGDQVEDEGVVKHRRGFDEKRWNGLVVGPALAAAKGATGAWFELALSSETERPTASQ
ncbi:MAG: hypothetical protein WA484_00640 [Solirubrobacteraceae bacterium]